MQLKYILPFADAISYSIVFGAKTTVNFLPLAANCIDLDWIFCCTQCVPNDPYENAALLSQALFSSHTDLAATRAL